MTAPLRHSEPMRVRVVWMDGVPPEVRVAVEPVLIRNLHRLPAWLYELRINWEDEPQPDEPMSAACSRTRVEYRVAWITIGPKWLNGETAWREDAIIHEMLHVPLHQMGGVFYDTLDAIPGDDDATKRLKTWAKEQWRMAVEATTCDLTEILRRSDSRPWGTA